MLKAYTYANCDTCRRAVKFLRGAGIAFQEIPIRETPPSTEELKRALKDHPGNPRRLFNTSGRDYKSLSLSAKIDSLTETEILRLLRENGNLVKRPFLVGGGFILIGFDEPLWRQTLCS